MGRVRAPIQGGRSRLSPELRGGLIIAVIAALAIGYVLWKRSGGEPGKEAPAQAKPTPITPGSVAPYALDTPAHGPSTAKAVLVKYTDFQWPYCTRIGPTLEQLAEHYGDKIRIEYHHFPLGFHKMAETSAVASMAAHKQGKFFDFVKKLYSDTKKQDKLTLLGYAKEIGLDVAQFEKDLDDPEVLRYVRMDAAAGGKIGVGGTPAMYLNGGKFEARELDDMKKAVDAEIAAVDALMAKGSTVEEARKKRIEDLTDTAKVYVEQVARRDTGAISVPAHGPDTAPAVIVKYTDFQWPYCTKVGPTLKEVEKHYGDKVRIEYHHYPLDFHKLARGSAIAAMAAHKQGKFFEMVDKLYSDTQKQTPEDIEKYAAELGLDVEKWKKDLQDPAVAGYVDADAEAGKLIGVSGTPSMFLNGRKLQARELDDYKREVDAEIAAVEALVSAGKSVQDARIERIEAANKTGGSYYEYMVERKPSPIDPKPLVWAGDAPKEEEAKPEPVDKKVYNAEIFPGDPLKGPLDALVTIVECTDFQWPFCGKVGPTLKQIHETWPKDVRIVLHNRPLDFHDRALPAAKAAMAASQQGKFWEYHDLLFEQKKFADADLLGYAKQLGLDVLRWKQDKDSKKTADLIAKQDQACVKIGASGTPAFFVNGRSLSGAKPFEDFKPLIEEELKKAQDELAKGVDRKRIYQHMLEIGAKAAPGGGEEKALDRSVARRIDTKGAPSMGPENAVAKLVIFSDFQWPYCSGLVKPAHEAVEQLHGQLRVTFMHLPLSFHNRARAAAIASMAAHRQGKFWEYHDLLFANQKNLTEEDLRFYGRKIGLHMGQFEKDYADPALGKEVDDQAAEAGRVGARGTPALYLNGFKVNANARSTAALVDLVKSEILKVE